LKKRLLVLNGSDPATRKTVPIHNKYGLFVVRLALLVAAVDNKQELLHPQYEHTGAEQGSAKKCRTPNRDAGRCSASENCIDSNLYSHSDFDVRYFHAVVQHVQNVKTGPSGCYPRYLCKICGRTEMTLPVGPMGNKHWKQRDAHASSAFTSG
jgi:hypothetical protein